MDINEIDRIVDKTIELLNKGDFNKPKSLSEAFASCICSGQTEEEKAKNLAQLYCAIQRENTQLQQVDK